MPPARGMLELREVRKEYAGAGERVSAVDGVSLAVRAGEMVAIHGPSGSGKTTLLMLAAALLRPDSGAISYEGRELSSYSESEVAEYLLSEVGFVYQRFRLMPRVSALENAARKLLVGGVGLREAQARARPWLERLGLADRLEHPPERLSGGERQRVALARVLAAEPRLILADEPTGHLDSARSLEITTLLGELARDREIGVLLVTHDLEAAALADRSLTLRDGQLAVDASGREGEPAPVPAATTRLPG